MPSNKPHNHHTTARPGKDAPPEVVDHRWLLKAVGLCLAGALLCGYATLCLLYYQGAWQLLLHPSQVVDRTPASIGIPFTEVRFGAAETGQPRLTGWWIPVDPHSADKHYAGFTILYLHDGAGSLSANVPSLAQLHNAGVNLFAIDYRGFGASDAAGHPTEERMTEDAEDALEYLSATRHIPIQSIIPYGAGLGGALAAHLAHANPELPSVVFDNPDPDPSSTMAAQSPSYIPARMLFGHPFDLAPLIVKLSIPKLLILGGPNAAASGLSQARSLFNAAGSPKDVVTLPAGSAAKGEDADLRRFLDEYLPNRTR